MNAHWVTLVFDPETDAPLVRGRLDGNRVVEVRASLATWNAELVTACEVARELGYAIDEPQLVRLAAAGRFIESLDGADATFVLEHQV